MNSPAPTFCGHSVEEVTRFRAEALERMATWAAFDARMRELLKPYCSRTGRVIAHTACREGDCVNCLACKTESDEETR